MHYFDSLSLPPRPDSFERGRLLDHMKLAQRVCGYALFGLLSGCSVQLLNPRGDIGEQEKTLIIVAMALMLLLVIPVIALTLYFAWRYRASNSTATYSPNWSHSTKIELVVWIIPIVIVVTLAVLIGKTTHSLDPYKPIVSNVSPVRVEVIALNWKWLFIYPDYGIASVNRMQLPVDTPVEFTLTADSLMNSFFIPRLGSQVYAMPGMQTKLHLIANHTGTFNGMSAAYSGSGFSDMKFDAVSSTRAEFDAWVAQAREAPATLDRKSYVSLARASHGYPVTLYKLAIPDLFDGIVNQYMHSQKPDGICTAAKAVTAAAAPATPNKWSK